MKYKSFFAFLGLLILVFALSRCGINGAETKTPQQTAGTEENVPFYPANNYIQTAAVAEDDDYIVYRNINEDFTGTYLYAKKGQTTSKILEEAASNFFLSNNRLFYTSGNTLLAKELDKEATHEVADGLTAMTAYQNKIYYANEQGKLYELDTITEQSRLLADAATLLSEDGISGMIGNLSLGDALYFTLTSSQNGKQVVRLFALQTDGSAKKIKEYQDNSNPNVVYDGGYLYFANDAGYNRMQTDGSREELLLPQGQDGNIYQQFFVYDGIWYYQKTTAEGQRYLCCQGALTRLKVGKLPQDGGEKVLLDLNKGDLSDIVNMNQTEKYLIIETANPDAKPGESPYFTWAINRKLGKAAFISELFPL